MTIASSFGPAVLVLSLALGNAACSSDDSTTSSSGSPSSSGSSGSAGSSSGTSGASGQTCRSESSCKDLEGNSCNCTSGPKKGNTCQQFSPSETASFCKSYCNYCE